MHGNIFRVQPFLFLIMCGKKAVKSLNSVELHMNLVQVRVTKTA